MRFGISGVLLSSLLLLIDLHCLRPNRCVKSLYKLKKIFANAYPLTVRHYFCGICLRKLDNKFCQYCNQSKNISYFLEMSILKQLECFYKRPEFAEKLNHQNERQKENDNNYEDLYDGTIYKSLPEDIINCDEKITFTWNTDGVPLYKSSKMSIWPFFLMINELPYKLRVVKENIILAGLWFGKMKPSPNLFMKSFLNDLKKLYNGVEFKLPNFNTIRVRGIVISGTCDLCAKALFMNIQQYNATYGCPNCKIKTRRVDNVQTYPFIENFDLRTTNESILLAREAHYSNVPILGVKGPTSLSKLAYDYVNSTAVDQMHCVFQGVTKKLMSFWFDIENRTHPSSLFSFLGIIDSKIKTLRLPSFLPRIPRRVSEFSYWKATELQVFLLVYSLPLLEDFMCKQYFEHHVLLVHAITLLNFSSISQATVDKAKRILTEYVMRFENLYGEKSQTCNVHLLLHLADDVKKFGPLWIMSCNIFENLNGILKSYIHGTRYAELQICSAVSTYLYLEEFKLKLLQPESEAFEFIKRIEVSGTRRFKTKHLFEKTYAVGVYKKLVIISDVIANILRLKNITFDENKCHIFKKILVNGMYFETKMYSENKKSNSSCMKYILDDVTHVGIIYHFITICNCLCEAPCNQCEDDCVTYAIIKKCIVNEAFPCPISETRIPTIFLCREVEDDFDVINIKNIVNVCYYFKVDDVKYVVQPANTIKIV